MVQQLYAGWRRVDADLKRCNRTPRARAGAGGRLCYRIYLRPDVRWTDGNVVTAHDYVYAWLRNLDRRQVRTNIPPVCWMTWLGHAPTAWGNCATEPGGYTGAERSHVGGAPGAAAGLLPLPACHPDHISLPSALIEHWGEEWWRPEHILSNGSFRLTHSSRRASHWNTTQATSARGVATWPYRILAIPDETERLGRFRSGDLDQTLCLKPPDDLAARLGVSLELDAWYFVLSPQPPLDDPRVRRAVAMAVDWRSLADSRAPRGRPGAGPTRMPGHTPGLALPYDRTRPAACWRRPAIPRDGDCPGYACRVGVGCRRSAPRLHTFCEKRWRWRSTCTRLGWRTPIATPIGRISFSMPGSPNGRIQTTICDEGARSVFCRGLVGRIRSLTPG